MTCEQGDKPIITYKFGSGGDRRYQSPFSPIEVITKSSPIFASNNYREEGFQVNYKSSQCYLNSCSFVVRDFFTFYRGNTLFVQHLQCDGSLSSLFALDTGDLSTTIDTSKKCSGAALNQRCSIQILYQGLALFQDQGDCPVSYSIQCGKCPEGTCECASSVYPGYCCLDCASISSQINQTISQVNSINR